MTNLTKTATRALAALLATVLLAAPASADGSDPDPSDAGDAFGAKVLLERVAAESAALGSAEGDGCVGDVDLCLHDGLFGVWGQLGKGDDLFTTDGRLLQGTKQAGVLYAYSDDNPELLVKVLNGCELNQHWWVYIGTATDQPFLVAIKHFPSDDTRLFRSSDIPLLGQAKINVWPCDP